jgi:hypothetical protein
MSTAKNEYTMDDSSYWLFENLDYSRACYFYCLHLSSRNRIDATRSSRLAAWGRVDRDFQKITTKKRKAKWGLNKAFHTFLHERWLQVGTSKQSCSHLYLLCKIWGFDNSLFLRCENFQSWCDTHACAVWCSWCTLEWLGYPYDELVIPKTIKGREGFEWRVAFSQPRYLARS